MYFHLSSNATDDAGGGYDTSLITSTYFRTEHYENDSGTADLIYRTDSDLAQSASFQNVGSGSRQWCR